MSSVHTEALEPRPPSKHAWALPTALPSNSRLSHVTSTAPAKRITFYRSGDSQFEGVRMAVHKRSFKCFDALLDDLSQKVPLPFGVRTVTTPRGTHTIRHLEQLQDGGCYLCSDQRQAKPINMELINKGTNSWQHQNRRPHRPESSSTTAGHSHQPYRQRRILLVRNSEPGTRRSVVLSRRSTRSLGAFLDEASDVMQFHVRKLYTVEGRRIDNVQTLMTCPSVLICVGREAFSPSLVNFIRKSSEEKMPSLGPRTPGNGTQGGRSPPHGAHSRSSQYSEDHSSKKNVNFGLETKKSIIHPRSDSSTRSARFSLSSEKSYGASSAPQPRAAIMNDDIEKRVLVNKDGTLSVEMRVRFRLHSDETLQWSTQIKKSPSLTNDCCSPGQALPHYLQQGQSESWSDPDCASLDPDAVDYSNQQCAPDGEHCPCCYMGAEPKYDLWENPHTHSYAPHPPPHSSSHTHTITRHTHSSSSSSSCNSRRVVRCRARLSSCRSGCASEHSQLVQEEMCVTEQVEHHVEVAQDGDTHVEVCKVSRSHSEVIEVDSSPPLGGHSGTGTVKEAEEEERPQSAISSSSHILQSLKEDPDDEDNDLPLSASQCCHNSESSPAPTPDAGRVDEVGGGVCGEHTTRGRTASSCCCDAALAQSTAAAGDMEETPGKDKTLDLDQGEVPATECEATSAAGGLTGSSDRSNTCSVCPDCGGCRRSVSSDLSSRASPNVQSEGADVRGADHQARPVSLRAGECRTSSAASKTSSHKSVKVEGTASAASAPNYGSGPSQSPCCDDDADSAEDSVGKSSCSKMSTQSCKSPKALTEAQRTERPTSALSAKSGTSAKTAASRSSHKSNCESPGKADASTQITDVKERETKKRSPSRLSARTIVSLKSGPTDRSDGARSAQSNLSAKSDTSRRSTGSHCGEGKAEDANSRPTSGMSTTNLSLKSNKSCKSTKASEMDGGETVASHRSGKSVKSTHSSKCKCNQTAEQAVGGEMETQQMPTGDETKCSEARGSGSGAGEEDEALTSNSSEQSNVMVDRAPSAVSDRSRTSSKSYSSHNPNQSAAPPRRGTIQDENEGRVNSAMSVMSKSTLKSKTSHTSNSSKKPSTPNIVTSDAPSGKDERAPSAASQKSNISSTGSHKSTHRDPADIAVTDAARDEVVGDGALKRAACSKATLSPRRAHSAHSRSTTSASPSGSMVQETSTGPGVVESKGLNAVSVQTPTSTNSGRSRCSCGAASDKTEKENENVSSVSCSSKRQPLSRRSSQSVSVGVPEDPDTAQSESGQSKSSSRTNKEVQEQDGVKTAQSHRSDARSIKSTPCVDVPAIDIPTIQMSPGGSDGPPRAPSVISVKSSKSSLKSSCTCSVKASAGPVSSLAGAKKDQEPRFLEAESLASAQSETGAKASKGSRGKDGSPSKAESDHLSAKGPQKMKIPVESLTTCPIHSNVEVCSESTVSAADLLRETIARPLNQEAKASKKAESSRVHQRTGDAKDQEEVLTPSCLPNASPSEVVSEWLRSIPANSSMLAPDDVYDEEDGEQGREGDEETRGAVGGEEQEVSPEDPAKTEDRAQLEEEEEVKSTKSQEDPDQVDYGRAVPTSSEALPKHWQSSAAVMKVLLSSSLGRCRSMPEVSPVYGRRLSTSAQGLLDCLAQLQLIGPTLDPCCDQLKERHQQYNDIMTILHSLWLTEPRNTENKDSKVGVTEVTSPTSSSGVGMSSNGSGKDNGHQEGDEVLPDDKMEMVETENPDGMKTESPAEKATSQEPAPGTEPLSLDSTKATENPSSSDKSSANNSSKSPTDNEQEMQDDTSSGTPPTVLRAALSKRMSQDPDPVWVLHLLKKLEKQFMSHYTDAMAEFKVRWDLDDNLILDRMICELKDEVGQRIQSSIEREIKKIKSRAGKAGRSPRPPQGGNLSRESTTTEKRRRLLKVMKNQSVKTADSHSAEEMTDDFSDQRSEDEYCPCDACVRKKMAARPLKENPPAAEAPVMMEFDLLKILQLKKSPAAPPKQQMEEEEEDSVVEKEERSLEVVQEEEEEEESREANNTAGTAEEVEELKVDVVGEAEEETAEGRGQGQDDGGGEAEDKAESSGQEEGEEAECHCHIRAEEDEEATKECDEDRDGTESEDGEEDLSSSDTVKEATAGDRGTVERLDGEEEEGMEGGKTKEASATHGADTQACSCLAEEEDGGGGTGEEDEEGEAESREETKEPDTARGGTEGEDAESSGSECKHSVEEEGGTLLHQTTRTSVESQPGSLEALDTHSPPRPTDAIQVPKMSVGGGGADNRRSRSPARVKRRKPKERQTDNC